MTAPEIRRDVEGYSAMNEDAFARRFYADRSELEALGIQLSVDKPVEGLAEQENYSLPPENFHLPAIEFSNEELAGLHTALSLLDGEFAYAEPLRLALQQISWGRPSPLATAEQSTIALGITASAGGHDLSQRLAKIETAIFRRKTIVFDYYTMQRDELGTRKVDPYQLLFEGGQFYLLGRAHERDAIRVFRLSRIRGKVAYASKAEHDFQRPDDFDPRTYANRVPWQFGETVGTAAVWIAGRIAWQIERHFGRHGELPRAGGRRGRRRRPRLRDRLRQRPPARRVGAGARRERADPARPASWSTELDTRLDAAARAPHRGRPRAGAGGRAGRARRRDQRQRQRPPRGRRDPPRALRAAGDARLDPDHRRPRRPADPRRRGLRAAADQRAGAERGHRRAQRRQLRRRLLRPLRRGAGGRHDRGRPGGVRRLVRAPGAAAAGRGEGARRGDRPDRRAHPRGLARLGPREKVVAALGEDPDPRGPAGRQESAAATPASPAASRPPSTSGGC